MANDSNQRQIMTMINIAWVYLQMVDNGGTPEPTPNDRKNISYRDSFSDKHTNWYKLGMVIRYDKEYSSQSWNIKM